MGTFSKQHKDAACWVLQAALETPENGRVAVVHDEDTRDLAECFADAARTIGIVPDVLFVPQSEQENYGSNRRQHLSTSIRKQLRHSARLIFLQHWSRTTTFFRFLVLSFFEQEPAHRAASMPGITLELLPLACRGNVEALVQQCRLVADRLLWTRRVTIRTYPGPREAPPLELHLELGNFAPITSSGRIRRSWGNVPSGESFICPNVGTAQGQININGSAPGLALTDGDSLPLAFEGGKARPCERISPTVQRIYNALLFNEAGVEASTNCSCLAELGIGLNPLVTQLTGNPILDEKMAGTVHLGLGSNRQFQGPIACDMHNDFVVCGCDLVFDGEVVIDRGVLTLRERDAFPNWKQVSIKYFRPDDSFVGTGNSLAPGDDVIARREWTSPRSTDSPTALCSTQVGDMETAKFAFHVIDCMEERFQRWTLPLMAKALPNSFPSEALPQVLELLLRFGLIQHSDR
jgi:leucyl aminopeptidase (aminopeptidase T)